MGGLGEGEEGGQKVERAEKGGRDRGKNGRDGRKNGREGGKEEGREGEREGGREGQRQESYSEAGGSNQMGKSNVPINQWYTAVLVLTNLHLDLQSSWPKESLIDHVNPIGHSDKQDIVQLLYSVNLGKEWRRWRRRKSEV